MAHPFTSARRSTARLPILILLGFCVIASGPWGSAQTSQQDSAPPASGPSPFREEVIAELSPDSKVGETILSDSHLVWVEEKENRKIVKLDGKQQGGLFEDVKHLQFSPKEDHFSFFGKRDSTWLLVMDGKEQSPAYSEVTGIAFQLDGSSFAYCACKTKKQCRLVVDGVETGPEYQDVSSPRYSHDGKRLAYFVKHEKKWVAVLDGKELSPEFDAVWFPNWGFSRNGDRFFAAGSLHHQWLYAVDGTLGPAFDVISPIAFSKDGKHYAYGGTREKIGMKNRTFGTIVVDGTAGTSYEGKGLGFFAEEVVAPGVRYFTTDFHGVSTPQFDHEGRLVYAARREKGDVAVFVGDNAGPGFDEILSPIAFSEDSAHFAYVAKRGEDFVEVHDNQPGKTVPGGKRGATGIGWIELSEDGKHLYYETVAGGRLYKTGETARALRAIVVDGQPGKQYDALGIVDFTFHEPSRIFVYEVYGAKGNRDLVNMNGQESRLFDDVSEIFPAKGSALGFIARDGGKFLRVTYDLSFASSAAPVHKAPELPALTAEELRMISDRGRMLAEYDAAAWHATDALRGYEPDTQKLGTYLARKTNGTWVVAFGKIDEKDERFTIAYEARQHEQTARFEIVKHDPPLEDKEFFLFAVRAIRTAHADFQGEHRPYNVAVLPGPADQLYVYFVPAPTETGVYPYGGDTRYLVSRDGSRIVEKRRLHNDILEFKGPPPPPPGANPSEVVASGHTHVLSDVPEDTDVFYVLSRKPQFPEVIKTTNHTYWILTDGTISEKPLQH